MTSSHDLRDALRDQERYAPKETEILEDLHRQRRQSRRLPRWSAGLLAAAAVCAIVMGVSALAGPHTAAPASHRTVAVPAPTAAPTAPVSSARHPAEPAGTPTRPPTSAQSKVVVPLTSPAAIQLMVDLLPADSVASDYTGPVDDQSPGYVSGLASYVRHGVRANIDVLFSTRARGSLDCVGFADFDCSVSHLSDGSIMVTAKSSLGTTFVQLVRPDGTLIMASEDATHDAQGTSTPPSKTNPAMPLTTTELAAVVRSKLWQVVLST